MIRKINENLHSRQLNKETEITNPEAWHVIYQIAVDLAYDAALRNHCEAHPEIFESAKSAVTALKEELEESLGIELEFYEMKSPTEIMEEAGFIKNIGGRVELTEQGKKAARNFGKVLERHTN